ncbi:outer membrane protein transport protein [Vibrio sp. SCSIO 43136]|uniref:outer membrane protein transport protein n=1 Tax=Vibrio sp. SCSIO 43136 TaxID=2819101 RepID=UPI002074DC36|nr:outer membrane protein transport protein [Vibrio sp. SCSIO 43136]USD64633.1 outer membrane protein transport protein [Vibrio sp. SCSIO 43136]
MNKKRLLNQAIVAAIALSSTHAMAAGFQLNGQSATGLGRAFAGDAVIADNASAMARNPAAMALFKKSSLSVGFNVIDTDVRIKEGTYFDGWGGEESISNTNGIGGTSFVPNFFFVNPVNEKFAWGVAAYSNFGTATQFKDDFAAATFGGTTSVKSANLGASLSYRINEQFSVGAGLDLIYGVGELKRGAPSGSALSVEADGSAIGWNIGTTYEVNPNHRFGLSYRMSPELEASGKVSTAITAGSDDVLYMPLPDMVEFSGYHRLAEKFAMHYSIQWVGWAEFDKIKTKELGTLKQYDWKDAGHVSIGGTYDLNSDWTLRAGYMYDVAATDKKKSISIPDSDRQWLSAGAGYSLSENSVIDFGFTYLIGQDVKLKEASDVSFAYVEATTRADAILFGLQYSHSF